MRAMILAAGHGKRMQPLTRDTPKPMLEVGGKPLIEYHIEALRDAGIDEIVINYGWGGEKMLARYSNGSRIGVPIRWSPEAEPLETAGGIRQALRMLGEEPFVLTCGDTWTDYDYSQLTGLADDDNAHLVLVDNPDHHPEGDFHLTAEGRVRDNGAPRLTYSGIACLRPRMFGNMNPEPAKLAPLLRLFMGDGRVSGEYHAGEWRDIGTPERLHELDNELRAGS